MEILPTSLVLKVKNIFLMFSGYFPSCNSCPWYLNCHCAPLGRVWLHSFHNPPFRELFSDHFCS